MATASKVYITEFMFTRLKNMRFLIIAAAIGMIVVWSSGSAVAEDIFVNNVSGNDESNGNPITDPGANSGPVKTIARALQLVQQGDRVVIQNTGQPYRECITIQGTRHSGTQYQAFTIVSDGATLDGTAAVNPRSWERYAGDIYRFMPELKSHQQLYMDGKPADRVWSELDAYLPDLEVNQWALVDGWIYFRADKDRLPTEYDLRYCKHQTGITLYEVNHVVIEGLVVQGFQLDGINAHEDVRNSGVRNCKIRGNGRSGLSVGGASRFRKDDSLVGSNGSSQIRTEGYCSLKIQDCRLLESERTGPAIDRKGGRILIDGNEFVVAMAKLKPNFKPASAPNTGMKANNATSVRPLRPLRRGGGNR